jgi:hypothetical protein
MWMTDYIREIQRQFVEVYNFPRRIDPPGSPWHGMPDIVPAEGAVPDGEYPMTIEGKLDRVKVKDGYISCCNFGKEKL